MHDLESALAFLSGQSRVRRDRIGVLGWGMGARFALRLAGATALHAVALEHIPLPGDPSDPNRHHGSILARFGAGDPGVSRRSMQEFVGRLRAAGDSVDSSVDEAHDAAANHRLELAFFERTLK
jgi:dienelactone hydrolase